LGLDIFYTGEEYSLAVVSEKMPV